jgi:hypothetical protein
VSDAPLSNEKVRYEFRVVWKRHGFHQKMKRYASLKAAEKRKLFLGPEPWLALGVDPDELYCCSGHECGCGGDTWREHLIRQRTEGRHPEDDGMPPIEYIRIEKRKLSPWEAV